MTPAADGSYLRLPHVRGSANPFAAYRPLSGASRAEIRDSPLARWPYAPDLPVTRPPREWEVGWGAARAVRRERSQPRLTRRRNTTTDAATESSRIPAHQARASAAPTARP